MNSDEIVRLLDELAERLTPTAQYAFDIVLSRVIIENLITLGVTVFLLAVSLVAVSKMALWSVSGYDRESSKPYGNAIDYIMGGLLGGVVFGAIGVLSLLIGAGALTNLLTPEYSTIVRILQAAGGVV